MPEIENPMPRRTKWKDPLYGAAFASAVGAILLSIPYADTIVSIVPFCLVPLLIRRFHPYRSLGFIPPVILAMSAAILATDYQLLDVSISAPIIAIFGGIPAGIVVRATLALPRRRSTRGRIVFGWMDVIFCWVFIGLGCLSIDYLELRRATTNGRYLLLAFLLLYTWIRLFRPFFELCVEALVWKGYRIRAIGPGATSIPIHGPLIVVANHACWWDPLFLAGVLPRPITPMMISLFYDKWFLKPLVVYVFGAIRVAESRIRREAPEIHDAIAALDAGKCVVIFPEAFLRRTEEVPLRRFGRGIWEILKARPDTPVVACWIEGSWGSRTSYWNGPPLQNKTPEFRRAIAVGLSTPTVLPAELLSEHLKTRIFLMNEVIAARKHLGLSELPMYTIPNEDEPTPAGPG